MAYNRAAKHQNPISSENFYFYQIPVIRYSGSGFKCLMDSIQLNYTMRLIGANCSQDIIK